MIGRRLALVIWVVSLVLAFRPLLVRGQTASPESVQPTNANRQVAADTRTPAALKPLLLVPLAVGLYFIYDRLRKRD